MKKGLIRFLAAMLAILMLLCFAACDKEEPGPSNGDGSQTPGSTDDTKTPESDDDPQTPAAISSFSQMTFPQVFLK